MKRRFALLSFLTMSILFQINASEIIICGGFEPKSEMFGIEMTQTHTVEKPVITPNSSVLNGPTNVNITCPTSGAIIYFTTNGTNPIPGGSATHVFVGPFAIFQNTTLKALAVKNNIRSQISTSVLTFSTNPVHANAPVITPGSGSFSGPQTISISCSTPNSTIYFTTTGNTPVVGTSFTRIYTGPFQLPLTGTIKALAVKSGMGNSPVSSSYISINSPSIVATPVIFPAAGSYSGPITIMLSSSTPGAVIYYTTSGNVPNPGSSFTRIYNGPFQLPASATVRAMAIKSNMASSGILVSSYSIVNPTIVSNPVITPASGFYMGPQTVTISSSTPGSIIYYTLTGNTPVLGAGFTKLYTGPFVLPASATIKAMAVKQGFIGSAVVTVNLSIVVNGGFTREKVAEEQLNPVSTNSLIVFPNPSSGLVSIKWENQVEKDVEFIVFNSLGTEVSKFTFPEGQMEVKMDFSELKSGIYFIKSGVSSDIKRLVIK